MKYKCIVCDEEIMYVDKTNKPYYYKIINKVHNWYCGPTCSSYHHNHEYKLLEEKIPKEEVEQYLAKFIKEER